MQTNKNIIDRPYPSQEKLGDIAQETYSAPNGVRVPTQPGYLSSFVDGDFTVGKFKTTRISDETTWGGNFNGDNVSNQYSKHQAWNADESLIMLGGSPKSIINASDYSLNKFVGVSRDAIWHPTDPDLIYGSYDNVLYTWKVSNDAYAEPFTFSSYDSISFTGESCFSNDGNYLALLGNISGDAWLIIYNRGTNSIETEYEMTGVSASNVDWVGISHSGTYACVAMTSNGSGTTQGMKKFVVATDTYSHFIDNTPHGDFQYDVNGNEVFVGFASASNQNADHHSLEMTRLDNGTRTPLFYWENGVDGHTTSGIWEGHISGRNSERPGWAYVSTTENTHPTIPSEMFAIKLDGSVNVVERFGKCYTNPTIGYYHEARMSVNRKGTKVIYTSNYDDATWESNTAGYAFITEKNNGL